MRAGIAFLAMALTSGALAVEPSERLSDPAREARARAISAELRCLVCQNESIDESHAELARDIRTLVRRQLSAGESDAATIAAVVDRYGDFVLLRPPVRPATWALWYGPGALLLAGFGAIALWLRRPHPAGRVSVPLTEAEQHTLATLTRERET